MTLFCGQCVDRLVVHHVGWAALPALAGFAIGLTALALVPGGWWTKLKRLAIAVAAALGGALLLMGSAVGGGLAFIAALLFGAFRFRAAPPGGKPRLGPKWLAIALVPAAVVVAARHPRFRSTDALIEQAVWLASGPLGDANDLRPVLELRRRPDAMARVEARWPGALPWELAHLMRLHDALGGPVGARRIRCADTWPGYIGVDGEVEALCGMEAPDPAPP